jgi:hypothetical protein
MDGDSDDYMNMVIADPVGKREKETYTQRRIRKQREVGLIHCFFGLLKDNGPPLTLPAGRNQRPH